MKSKEEYNKKLLVEGNDDQHVVWALCTKYEIPHNFDVIDCDGVDKLIDQIPVRLKTSGIETIGIIVDADDKPRERWRKLSNILTKSGFSIPKDLPARGLIVSNGKQKVGVWIMPNNKLNGMLEDFISFLIPPDDQLYSIVQSTLDDIEAEGLNKYKPCHKAKATIHTWLAWQEDPGTPLGLSIKKRYLTTDDVATCTRFTDWLKELFL